MGNYIANVSSITKSISPWEGISPKSTDKLAWNSQEHQFAILSRFADLSSSGKSKTGEVVAAKMTDLSREYSEKLQEITQALENQSINDDEFADLVKELNQLSSTLIVFRQGLKTIMGEQRPLKKPGKDFLSCMDDQLHQIAKLLVSYPISDHIEPDELFEIAKFCAVRAPEEFLPNIQKFKLKEHDQLFEFLSFAKNNPGSISQSIIFECSNAIKITDMVCVNKLVEVLGEKILKQTTFLHIKLFAENLKRDDPALPFSQDELFKIAKLYAKHEEGGHASVIKSFGLDDQNQNQLIELALLFAQNNGVAATVHIGDFGITDQVKLLEIAKVCANYSAFFTVDHIQNFILENEQHLNDESQRLLFEIAMVCANKASYKTLPNLGNFGITNSTRTCEIALVCLQNNSSEIPILRTIFNESDLFEIAKLYIEKSIYCDFKKINEFGIINPDKLLEIMMILVQKNGANSTLHDINIIKQVIKDPEQIFKITEYCAQKEPLYTLKKIKEFGINEPNKLFTLFKTCMTVNRDLVGYVLYLIEGLNLTDDQIFELAKLGLDKDRYTCISSFKGSSVKDPSKRLEFAKLCALQSGPDTAENIKKFGIESPLELFEIAKLCAQESAYTARYIQNFGLDPSQLFTIAKNCAQQEGADTARGLLMFGINDQDQLFEIAKLCIQQNVMTAELIQNFGIEDQDRLFQLAMLCAHYSGKVTSEHVQNFGIEDLNKLFKIAMLSAQQSPIGITEYIQNFKFDQEKFLEILKVCLQYAPQEEERSAILLHFGNKTDLKGGIDISTFIPFIEKGQNPDELTSEDFAHAADILKPDIKAGHLEGELNKVLANIIEISDPLSKYQNMLWLINTVIFLNVSKDVKQLTEEHIQWLGEQGLIEAIADLGQPSLRFPLSFCALSLASSKIGRDAFSKLAPARSAIAKTDTAKKKENFQQLSALLYATLVAQGIDVNIVTGEGSLRNETLKPSSIFDDKENAHALLQMHNLLLRDTDLSAEEKGQVLKRIVSEMPEGKNLSPKGRQAAYLRNIQSVTSIIEFKEDAQLKNTMTPVVKIAEDSLKEKLACGDVDDFMSKYIEKFKECRNPTAIITYTSKIHSLNDQAASACLGTYVSSTLNGTFKEDRYSTDHNPHLKKLSEFSPTLLDSWKQSQTIDLEALEFDAESVIPAHFSAKDWIAQNLKDNHIPNLEILDLSYLKDYLEESDSKALSKIETQLKEDYQASLKKQKPAEFDLKSIKNLNENIEKIRTLTNKLQTLEKQDNQKDIKRCQIDIQNQKANFQKNLASILEDHPDLKQQITPEDTFDEVMKRLEGCKDAAKKAQDDFAKLKMQQLCIQWIKISDSEELRSLSDILRNLDPIKNPQEFKLNKSKIDLRSDQMKNILVGLLATLEGSPFNSPPFFNDIDLKIKERPERKTSGKEIAVETDDPIDLLLCGSDISDSCQRVDYLPSLNKGLLGYMVDGKNKLLAVKSPEGRIKARCLLRLLWDGEQPVLFMERLYPFAITPKQKQALEMLAKNKATQLGIPLLYLPVPTQENALPTQENIGAAYGKTLLALGGPSPWEYCDGASGDHVTKGEYEIRGAKHLS